MKSQTKNNKFKIELEKNKIPGSFAFGKDFVDVHTEAGTFRLPLTQAKNKRQSSVQSEGGLSAPMPGKILKVLVQEGAPVKAGETLLILEAMKMEHKISSPKEGKVKKIYFPEGARVTQGENLCEVE